MRLRQQAAPSGSTPPAVPRLLLVNKPFGVLTQFTSKDGRPTLRD